MSYEGFKQAELKGWDARAQGYNENTGALTTRAIPTLMAMAEIAPGHQVLDLCCGTGRAVGAAAALGAIAEGLDISPQMIAHAKSSFPNAKFEVGDAEAIPRADDTYDAVICSFGLMHVGSPQTMLEEIARVLRPGGRLALSHWLGPQDSPLFRVVFGTIQRLADMSAVPPAPSPFALSDRGAMKDALARAGFSEISIRPIPLTFSAPAGKFAEQFRMFAARAAVILDQQEDDVLQEIHDAWEVQLDEYLVQGAYQIPMPALAVSAAR